eukprot:gene21223-28136_t
MNFSALDMQALRGELGAARRERLALAAQATELEQELGLDPGTLLQRDEASTSQGSLWLSQSQSQIPPLAPPHAQQWPTAWQSPAASPAAAQQDPTSLWRAAPAPPVPPGGPASSTQDPSSLWKAASPPLVPPPQSSMQVPKRSSWTSGSTQGSMLTGIPEGIGLPPRSGGRLHFDCGIGGEGAYVIFSVMGQGSMLAGIPEGIGFPPRSGGRLNFDCGIGAVGQGSVLTGIPEGIGLPPRARVVGQGSNRTGIPEVIGLHPPGLWQPLPQPTGQDRLSSPKHELVSHASRESTGMGVGSIHRSVTGSGGSSEGGRPPLGFPKAPMAGGPKMGGGIAAAAAAAVAVQEGVKRRVLRENGVKRRVLRETVVTIACELTNKAVDDACREVASSNFSGSASAPGSATLRKMSSKSKTEKGKEEGEKLASDTTKQMQELVDKQKKENELLTREKKTISGKVDKLSKQAKEAKKELEAVREREAGHMKQIERHTKAAERAKAEADKMKLDGDKKLKEAISAHQTAVKDLANKHELELDAMNKKHAQDRLSSIEHTLYTRGQLQGMERELQELKSGVVVECGEQPQEVQEAASGMMKDMGAEFESLYREVIELKAVVGGQLLGMERELQELKVGSLAVTGTLRSEVMGARTELEGVVGEFRNVCKSAAKRCSDQASKMMRMDKQMSALGPGGLDSLLLQLATSRSQVAQLEAMREALQLEVKASEESSWRAMREALQLEV